VLPIFTFIDHMVGPFLFFGVPADFDVIEKGFRYEKKG
jgi:hypothetical protein